MKFDPAAPALKLVAGFLFSSTPAIPPITGALFLTNPFPVLESKESSAVVVVVVEIDSNKVSPQLPISVNVSWPRLNLGGANEYLFFFFAGTGGAVDNEDTLNPSGGNKVDSSFPPSADRSAGWGPGVMVAVEMTEALGSSSACRCCVEGIFRNCGCWGCELDNGDFSIMLIGKGLSRWYAGGGDCENSSFTTLSG